MVWVTTLIVGMAPCITWASISAVLPNAQLDTGLTDTLILLPTSLVATPVTGHSTCYQNQSLCAYNCLVLMHAWVEVQETIGHRLED